MSKQKDSLILYYGLYEDLQNLTKTEIADVILATFNYEINGVSPTFKSRSAKIVFRNIAKSLDINKRKYEELCEKNRENINKRWAKEYAGIRPYTNEYECKSANTKNTDTDTVYVTEKETYNDTYNDSVCVKDNISSQEDTPSTHTHKKHYGIFSNILLDDSQYEQFRKLHPTDYQQRIDSMSSYMKAQGKTYQDDYARLCTWRILDKEEKKPVKDNSPSYDIDAYMKQSLNLVYEKVN